MNIINDDEGQALAKVRRLGDNKIELTVGIGAYQSTTFTCNQALALALALSDERPATMKWNYRIVHLEVASEHNDNWCAVQEVHYNDDGSVAGYCDPCLGSEYPESIPKILQRMLADIQRNPDPISKKDVVGFKDQEADVVPF